MYSDAFDKKRNIVQSDFFNKSNCRVNHFLGKKTKPLILLKTFIDFIKVYFSNFIFGYQLNVLNLKGFIFVIEKALINIYLLKLFLNLNI